jgi:hypothetical protein
MRKRSRSNIVRAIIIISRSWRFLWFRFYFSDKKEETQNETMVRAQRSEDPQPFPRNVGWMGNSGLEEDEGAERGATRGLYVVSVFP